MRDLNKLPVPELIDGRKWEVGEAVGHHTGTNPKGHEMFVPIDENCERCGLDHDRYIRCHELVHAKYSKGSPTDKAAKAGVTPLSYHLAEECYIEAFTIRSFPDLDPGVCVDDKTGVHETTDRTSMAIRNDRPDQAAEIAIAASLGLTPIRLVPTAGIVPETSQDHLYRNIKYFASAVIPSVMGHRYTNANVAKLAKVIDSFLGSLLEAMAETEAEAAEAQKGESEGKKPGAGSVGATTESEEQFRAGRMSARLSQIIGTGDSGPAKWGRMQTLFPPRPINLNKKFGVRKYRAAPEGARVRNISRFYADQKVFGRKRRYRGGTLLVDGSGSMSFSYEDLQAIVENAPATTIALYSGNWDGWLKIIAKGGTCVEPKNLATLGGNEVDGPALDWLGKQREPRIWLSDGQVCANGGGDLYGDAGNKCRKYNIRRVRWLEQAIKAYTDPTVGVRGPWDHPKVDTESPPGI